MVDVGLPRRDCCTNGTDPCSNSGTYCTDGTDTNADSTTYSNLKV